MTHIRFYIYLICYSYHWTFTSRFLWKCSFELYWWTFSDRDSRQCTFNSSAFWIDCNHFDSTCAKYEATLGKSTCNRRFSIIYSPHHVNIVGLNDFSGCQMLQWEHCALWLPLHISKCLKHTIDRLPRRLKKPKSLWRPNLTPKEVFRVWRFPVRSQKIE